MELRRIYTLIDEIFEEGGRALERPLKRVAAAAVIRNPLAGAYHDDLSELMDIGAQLGKLLGERAVAALNGDPPHSYGKAAIVGMAGEREHAAALLHPKLGAPLRAAVSGASAYSSSDLITMSSGRFRFTARGSSWTTISAGAAACSRCDLRLVCMTSASRARWVRVPRNSAARSYWSARP